MRDKIGTFDFILGELLVTMYKSPPLLVTLLLPVLFGGCASGSGVGGHDSAVARALVIQSDAKPVAAGVTCVGNRCDIALARYLTNGRPDASFGVDGKVVTHFAGSVPAASSRTFAGSYARSLVVQADGKLVVAGLVNRGNSSSVRPAWAIARYLPDGSLDDTFGSGGMVATEMAKSQTVYAAEPALALQPDGKLVLAAYEPTGAKFSKEGTSFDEIGFVLIRYLPDGRLDGTFGKNGRANTGFSGRFAYARALKVQPDGKLIAAGIAIFDGLDHFALARYLADGSLDTSFGKDGTVTAVISYGESGKVIQSSQSRGAFDLDLEPGGSLISCGASEGLKGRTVFALARFLQDGSLDRSFGKGGTVATDFGNGGIAFAIARHRDGKVVVAGTTGIADLGRTGGEWPCEKFALARYLPNGDLDRSFGADGKSIGDQCGRPMAVRVQSDGTFIVAGRTIISERTTFTLARYFSDGRLDAAFGIGGKVTTDFAGTRADIRQ